MSSWQDQSEQKNEPVVVDVYGVKASLRPGDLGEQAPRSWADVGEQLKGHLLRLAVAPTRLLVELIEGLTRLVRGSSYIPEATASRIRRARIRADHQERQAEGRPEAADAFDGSSHRRIHSGTADELVDRLDRVLERIRAQGRDAAVVLMPNGAMLIVAGTPENMRGAIEAAANDALRLGDPSVVAEGEPVHGELPPAGGPTTVPPAG